MKYLTTIFCALLFLACSKEENQAPDPVSNEEPMCGLANGVDFLAGMDNCWEAEDGERLFIQEDCVVYQEKPDGGICFGNMASQDCEVFILNLCEELRTVKLIEFTGETMSLEFLSGGERHYKRTYI